jgi:hypothetical protein
LEQVAFDNGNRLMAVWNQLGSVVTFAMRVAEQSPTARTAGLCNHLEDTIHPSPKRQKDDD